jgi:hypothetical protein
MPTADGATYTGTSRIDNFPASNRIYDQNKKWVRITHGRRDFSRIMMENFKSSTITATDPEPKYRSDVDRDILFMFAAASDDAGGTENKIYLLDALAADVEVGGMLLVHGVWYDGTTYVTTRTSANNAEEQVRILQKGTSDGTKTWFIVQRGYAAWNGGSAGTPPEITTAMYGTLLPKTVGEGSDEASSYSDTAAVEQNYLQIFLEKWSVAETTQNTVTYQAEPVLARNGRKALDRFFKKLEWAMQNGHKGTGVTNGKRWWTTGGFKEYVYQANTQLGYTANQNVEDFTTLYGTMSPQAFNMYIENKWYYGNPDMKYLILGATVYTKYCNAFDSKVRIVNPELTKKYGIQIVDHLGSNGGTMHIIKSDDLSINQMGNFGMIVDFSHFQYMHMQAMDLQIIKDVETNPHETVNEIYGQIGVHRTNPFAHWITWNF